MVFRPTMEQFRHFGRYIQYMESMGAHKVNFGTEPKSIFCHYSSDSQTRTQNVYHLGWRGENYPASRVAGGKKSAKL